MCPKLTPAQIRLAWYSNFARDSGLSVPSLTSLREQEPLCLELGHGLD
jgi:hypothetical protein